MLSSGSRNAVVLGIGNTGRSYWGIMIGSSNDSKTYNGARLIGDNLVASDNDQFIFGRYNALNPSLSGANFIFGCGIDTNHKANFMEASYDSCKICKNLQLATDATEVNAITAPLSNPASADDQTLATKAYVDSHTLGITVPRADVLLTGQSTSLEVGEAISLETDLSLTIPSWTKQIRLGIHNSGGYVEYLLIDNISSHSYVSVTGAGTVDVYSYNPATTTFTFISGGTSMSIVSVRAEGTTSI